MATGSVSRKDLLSGIKKATVAGPQRTAALKKAAEFGVKRGIGGNVSRSTAKQLVGELRGAHELRSRLGADQVPTYGTVVKHLVDEMVGDRPKEDIVAERQAHLAEKREMLKDAGLKVESHEGPKSKAELHIAKANEVTMERALDTSGVEELNIGMSGLEGDGNGVAAAPKSAAGELGLKPVFSVPHPVASKMPPHEALDDHGSVPISGEALDRNDAPTAEKAATDEPSSHEPTTGFNAPPPGGVSDPFGN